MLTIFAAPKPFRGHIGLIQRNAARSWAALGPDVEVLLLGDEEGTAAVAAELGVRHVPDIDLNEYGTPLIGSIFRCAEAAATHDWLCYVNADVILCRDLVAAVDLARRDARAIMLSGRRWHVTVEEELDPSMPGWQDDWARRVRRTGWLDSVKAMDWFAFRRGAFGEVPDFAIGRTAWDAFLMHRARARGALVVDATEDVLVAHQDHEYDHPDGKPGIRRGPERRRNRELAGDARLSLGQVTHKIEDGRIVRALDGVRLRSLIWTLSQRPRLGRPLALVIARIGPRAKTYLLR